MTEVKKKKSSRASRSKAEQFVGPDFVLDEVEVPLPVKARGAERIYFPFDVLEVGKSFTTRRTLGTVRRAIRLFRVGGDETKTYAAREVDGGVRCWRTK